MSTTNIYPIVLVSHHLSIDGFAALADALRLEPGVRAELLVLSEANARIANLTGLPAELVHSLESFTKGALNPLLSLIELRRRYPEVPWGTVVASERSFTDYSFLMGGTGHRSEKDEYIVPLVLRIVSFFDAEFERLKPRAIVSARGDNIFNQIALIVAEAKNIPLLIPQPAYLNEGGALEAGYLGNTQYLESFAMIRIYLELKKRPLTNFEREKATSFAEVLRAYDGKKMLAELHKKSDFDRPLTPQKERLFSYLSVQNQLNAEVDFYKINWQKKLWANILRLVRQTQGRRFFASQKSKIPDESVFYAMHFQPEASTLVNGIWYSNQIALIETLSKALPLGYTLVIKEHPRGRGMRPLWQYEHVASLHNVIFSDLPSKEIVRKCQMIVSISGSIGLEALAMRKPVLMLGRTFHTFTSLYYRANAPQDLPALFYKVLVGQEFALRDGLVDDIHRFLLAYLGGKFLFSPVGKSAASKLASCILLELEQATDEPREWLNKVVGTCEPSLLH